MKDLVIVLLLTAIVAIGLTGCSETRHVSGSEFQREYELRHAQTMVFSEYLGERDGKVFLKRSFMSTVTSKRWSHEVCFTETNQLDAAFLDRLRSAATATGPSQVTIVLFDSADSTHPSPRDSRWMVTNAVHASALSGHLLSARVLPADGPPVPECAIVACVELPAIGGATNCTFIHHVHFATSVLLSRDDKHLALTNSAGFLADLAQAGFPTNRLVADNKP